MPSAPTTSWRPMPRSARSSSTAAERARARARFCRVIARFTCADATRTSLGGSAEADGEAVVGGAGRVDGERDLLADADEPRGHRLEVAGARHLAYERTVDREAGRPGVRLFVGDEVEARRRF